MPDPVPAFAPAVHVEALLRRKAGKAQMVLTQRRLQPSSEPPPQVPLQPGALLREAEVARH
eukprot:11191776-Lingulodinium_polyedra.AAC.1